MSKDIVVSIAGAPPGQNLRELSILPGSTAADILNTVNLPGYLLSPLGTSRFFASDENVYAAVEPGAKLVASTPPTVGQGGLWEALCRFFGLPEPPPPVDATRA